MTQCTEETRALWAAISAIKEFIGETTGTKATDMEIARALKRYFVLNEIKEHVLLERKTGQAAGD